MFRASKPIEARVHAIVNAAFALLTLVAVFVAANWHRMPDGWAGFLAIRITVKNLLVGAVFLFGCMMGFLAFGLSRPLRGEPFWKEIPRVSGACLVASLLALLFPLTSISGAFPGRIVLYYLPAAIVTSLCGRGLASAAADRMARALSGRREVIIVGSGPRAWAVHERFQQEGYAHILGFLDSANGHSAPPGIAGNLLGRLEDLESILVHRAVDEVVIALPVKSCYDQIQTAIQTCERVGVEAKYLPDVFQLSLARPKLETHDSAPLVSLEVVHDDYRLVMKRAVDIAGALCGIVALGPLMLAIAAAIRLTSPGPAIFAQERYGLRKRRFRMYKFRTMLVDAEKRQAELEASNEVSGPVFKIRNDPRITAIGRILRRTSLDELPQFLNVLKGEMSLVGPRPLPERDVSRFGDAWLMRRFSVRPGISCLWQISGRSNTPFERWIELDLQYIDKWSLWLDFKILLGTLPAIIRGDGAS
ncbi:MAG TPA: sugar transferase [Bryobacteraceae bacterium]|nr:sugar transferase [Bryobacteraceae bacterium]